MTTYPIKFASVLALEGQFGARVTWFEPMRPLTRVQLEQSGALTVEGPNRTRRVVGQLLSAQPQRRQPSLRWQPKTRRG